MIKHWWARWHEAHPYQPAPPHYVQNNPAYRPETVITREEFNIYTQVLGTMLVQFAEKIYQLSSAYLQQSLSLIHI